MKMKSIKQIRKDNDESSKEKSMISSLCENGLLDADKAIFFERALNKDVEKLTISERKILKNVVESLMIENHSRLNSVDTENLDESVKRDVKDYLAKFDPTVGGNKFPTDKDMPQVLILKRKAIRIYPDNQKVALYYSDALNKYVTIPFGAIGINEKYDPEAIANMASSELKSKEPDFSRFVAKNVPLGREKDPRLLDAMEKKIGYRPDVLGFQKSNVDKTNLPDFSKLGLKHGISARGSVLNLIQRRKEKSELKAKQKDVLSDLEKRKPTIMKFKQRAKDTSLTDKQRSRAKQSARKWSSYRLAAKRSVGLRENFALKLEEKRNINEFLSTAAKVGLRLGGSSAIEKGLSRFLNRSAQNKKPDAKPADRVPDTEPEAPKPANKPADKPDAAPTNKPEPKTEPKPAGKSKSKNPLTRGLRRLRVLGRRMSRRLPGAEVPDEKDNSKSTEVQYSKVSEPVKTPEFSPERPELGRAGRFSTDAALDTPVIRAQQQSAQQIRLQKENVVKELYDVKGKTELNINGNSVVVNEVIAEKLIKLHESLSQENKHKMESMLNEDVDSFRRVLEFAVRQK